MIAGFFSALLIVAVSLLGSVLRLIPFEPSSADIVLGLMRPLGVVTFVINLVFSFLYLFLRTDLFENE